MKKIDIILNIITILVVIGMIAVTVYVVKMTIENNNKVYVQKWHCEETGVNYLITNDSIIEMHNPDGTIYAE